MTTQALQAARWHLDRAWSRANAEMLKGNRDLSKQASEMLVMFARQIQRMGGAS